MAEPGGDDEKEGKYMDEDSSVFGDYRCVFRGTSDSLYIMMKNVKTKRTFNNTFSKTALNEMDLKQSIDKVVNLLNEAKTSKKSELSFKIAFGDAENDKKVAFGKLSQNWSSGDALFVFVAIEHSYFTAEYVFKLLEQKRSETDILHDIIVDMQHEIHQLKHDKTGTTGIATWFTVKNSGFSGNITMDGCHLESTLRGMVALSDNKGEIIIGIAGLYKISCQIFFTSGAHGTTHQLYIRVNGTDIIRNHSSTGGGFGYMQTIVNLKQNDKVTFNTNYIYATKKEHNHFSVQKLSN